MPQRKQLVEFGMIVQRYVRGQGWGGGEHRADSILEVMVLRDSGKDSVLEPSWCGVNTESRQTTVVIILSICKCMCACVCPYLKRKKRIILVKIVPTQNYFITLPLSTSTSFWHQPGVQRVMEEEKPRKENIDRQYCCNENSPAL